jgi:hypothetical protein
MTDRELLEAAAKAAGISGEYFGGTGAYASGIWRDFEHGCRDCWNPLTDDGDALRLAVKLRMTVAHEPSRGGWSVGRVVATVGGGEFKWLAHDEDGKRAIVQAASAMALAVDRAA